jgi:hypothetical protein
MPRTTPRGLIVAFLALALSSCSAGDPSSPDPLARPLPPGAVQHDATQLRPGDCLATIPDDLVATLVPCGNPHAAEFAMIYVVPDGAWPGSDAAVQQATAFCAPRMRIRPRERDKIKVSALPPLQHDWPRHRTAYCVAVAKEGQLVGRVLE